MDTGAYSDSEVSSVGGVDAIMPSTSTAFSKGNNSTLAEYDKRKKKKYELLEEVISFIF